MQGGSVASLSRMRILVLVCVVLCVAMSAMGALDAPKLYDPMSSRPATIFPGGTYKSSTKKQMPTSTISGALISLKAGGVRELHWHVPSEWAYVIAGTCRATVLVSGATHPFDTWDFTAGDIWFFPSNAGHAILGLEPEGCSFIAGFDDGAFDEMNALSTSSFLATVPADILAQALGINQTSAEDLLANSLPRDGKPTFMPMGKKPDVFNDAPSVSRQFPPVIHRFPLASANTPEVLKPDSSYINVADVALFPAGDRLIGACVRFAPGALRALHWHTTLDEWQFVLNGSYQVGVFLQPGVHVLNTLHPGDVGFAPKGSGHWLKNTSPFPAYIILIFGVPDGRFTNIENADFLGVFPPAWVAASLNTTIDFAAHIDFTLDDFAPKFNTA